MEKLKKSVIDNFEKTAVLAVLASVLCITYLVDEKMAMLNFFYLPVLIAAYFIGKRASLLVAMFSILAVTFFVILNTDSYMGHRGIGYLASGLCGWAGFLVLTSHVVGTLYEQRQKRIDELQQAYVGILEILVKFLESTDRYSKGHSERVAEIAMDIAIAMQLPRSEVENIRVAALLHDIGKIEISANLIGKAASLTQEEMMQVSKHTEKGAKILLSVGSVLKEAIPIVLEHHKYYSQMEKASGNGSKSSSLGTSIVAVADAFDAMTSDRPYRKGMPPWRALEELKNGSGHQFDPEVVEVCGVALANRFESG